MTTFTIELPDEVAERLSVLPAEEVQQYTVDALRILLEPQAAVSTALPSPGFDTVTRLTRLAHGDQRTGGEVITTLRRAEWQHREQKLRLRL